METLKEEANPSSAPATEQPGLCLRPQVTASHGDREDRESWDGAGGLEAEAGLVAVPRQPPPSPTAGAQSRGPAPHSPCCSPSPCPGQLEHLGEQWEGAVGGTELPGPQTVEWDLAREEREWEPDLGQELPQCGSESVQELDQREGEKYQDLSQGEFERDKELPRGEAVRCQEPSQKQDVNVRELYKWDDKRNQVLSEGEIDPELYHRESERHQMLSKWLDMGIQVLAQGENNSDKMFSQWEQSTVQELSEGEVIEYPESSLERGNNDKNESEEDWECITIRTIWVNPKYPQLLQDPDAAPQDLAKAAASLALAEQGKAAGAQSQSPAPHSPCCPSAPQPGAQALREQPAPPKKRRSRFRRALRALFCRSCLRPQPDNRCPLPAPGRAPQLAAGPEPAHSLPGVTRAASDGQVSRTAAPCRDNGLAEV
ncbi:hypothetical protein DUI87_15637 [Hirundo rustica rustica]|uniref:Uncharacterized protein n=1 Tax=Hirundo rustica rustica TaxID=333673 RepID=A0A3M0KGG1_HIRRU|nr:hypothetical protein DUI87_15637 [Hirundo rustica rustica]